jgi:C1A family cysteine protease
MPTYKKGLKRDHIKHQAFKAQAHKHLGAVEALPTLPGSTAFRSKIAPPMNQQQCGCCWAFSITNSLRSLYMLAGKDPGVLSFNYLINNCGGVANEDGCNGGDFDAGLNMLNNKGPWLESQDPFTGTDGGQCKVGLNVAATAERWVVVGDGNSRPTALQLCEAIWNNGQGRCLSVDVAADDNWSNYQGGIYSQNTSQEIDHLVRIVDYDAQTSVDSNGNAVFNTDGSFKNGDGFFWVRNNWDTTWGENGDMQSRYGANNLAETAMFFDFGTPVVPTVAHATGNETAKLEDLPIIPSASSFSWQSPVGYAIIGAGILLALEILAKLFL